MDLDNLVRENRFTIAFVFPLVGAITLLASYEGVLPDLLSYNPFFILFGTLVMRLPLLAGIKPLIDRKAAAGLTLLVIYSYVIEYIGVKTGFPYGSFSYGIDLGPMILGKIPLALPIFFIPLVLNAYLLILLLKPERVKKFYYRITAITGAVLFLDLVLDPAAVAINFWNYGSGIYYNVPVSNYLGWILSASVSVLVLDFCLNREKLIERLEECEFMLDDMVSFGLLWGLINLYFANYIPFILSILLLHGLAKVDRFDFVSTKKSLRLTDITEKLRPAT